MVSRIMFMTGNIVGAAPAASVGGTDGGNRARDRYGGDASLTGRESRGNCAKPSAHLTTALASSALSAVGHDEMSDGAPPPNTTRWVVRRKAAVIAAVRSGRITLEEALRRYQLTEEEYRYWERAFEQHGLPGLRATRLHEHR